jgi:DNA topoisomerase III
LITLLRGLGINELCSPELTGDWEFKLKQMEHGDLQRPEFMKEIVEMTKNIVHKTKQYESDTVPGDFATLKVPCPKCGGQIKETYKKFQCTTPGCDFSLWRIVAGRQMEPQEMEELLANKKVGPLQGFKSKMGRPFAAIIKFTPELKAEFDFGQGADGENGQAAEVDFSGQTPIGKCLKCGSNVYEHGMQYVCEKAVGPKKTCDFRTGKIILQRQIEPAQVVKLLETGKTDLLHKFISKKNRPFSAFLVYDKKTGRVGFEFAPREPKTAKGKAAAATAKAAPKKEPAAASTQD